MKTACTLFTVICASLFYEASAQEDPGDYIINGTAYLMGKVLPLNDESIEFQKSVEDSPVVFTAHDIIEYRHHGNVYESLFIRGKQRFVERIVSGEASLYKFGKLYALKTAGRLVSFSREDYHTVIGQTTQCVGNDDFQSKLRYSRMALGHYVTTYNKGNCNWTNFPYKKFGIYAGFNFLQFGGIDRSLDLKESMGTPTLSFFWDRPLYRPRTLFLTTELNLLYANNNEHADYFELEVSGINAMFNAKWIVRQRRVKTYFKAGPYISFLHIDSPAKLVKTIVNGTSIILKHHLPDASESYLGINLGVGLEIPYKTFNKFHFEFRYLRTVDLNFNNYTRFALSPSFDHMKFTNISIVAGYSI